MAALAARAASFLAQAVSFHLLSISAAPHLLPRILPSWKALATASDLAPRARGITKSVRYRRETYASGKEQTQNRDLLSLDTGGRSINQHLENQTRLQASYSLSVDNVDNRAELTEVASIVDVSDTSSFNKSSEHLYRGLETFLWKSRPAQPKRQEMRFRSSWQRLDTYHFISPRNHKRILTISKGSGGYWIGKNRSQ